MALKKMTFSFITINMLLNGILYTHTLVDSECLCFGMMTKKTVKQNKLKWFPVPPWQVIDVMDKPGTINEMTKTHINIDEYTEICYFYIKGDNFKYDLILSKSWLNRNNVWVVIKKKTIYFGFTGLYVKSTEDQLKKITSNIHKINNAAYASWMRQAKKQDSRIKVFAAFMTDIEKILCLKLNINPWCYYLNIIVINCNFSNPVRQRNSCHFKGLV